MFTVALTNHTLIHAQDEQPVTTITKTASIVPYARVCSCGNGTYYLASTKAGSWATKKKHHASIIMVGEITFKLD